MQTMSATIISLAPEMASALQSGQDLPAATKEKYCG